MYLKVESDSPVQFIGKLSLFVHPDDLHMCVYFGFLADLAVALLMKPFQLTYFTKIMFLMRRCIIIIWSQRGANISEYTPLSDPWVVLQTKSDGDINAEHGHSRQTRTSLFQDEKSNAIPPNTGTSFSVRSRSADPICMVQHPSWLWTWMVLPPDLF